MKTNITNTLGKASFIFALSSFLSPLALFLPFCGMGRAG